MKRARPGSPGLPSIAREEIDLRSSSRDSRRDPGATAKISREELEAVLARSTSGLHEAVRPGEKPVPMPVEARTRSGERVAVRPSGGHTGREEVASDRPTAPPAMIGGDASLESESDRIADSMYRAVTDGQPTLAQPAFVPPATPEIAELAPQLSSVSAGPAAPAAPESEPLVFDPERRARRARLAKIATALVVVTGFLAIAAWFVGRWLAVTFQH